MKNKLILRNSFIAMYFELVWVIVSISIFANLYMLLIVPEEGQIIDVSKTYTLLGYENIPEATLNLIMGLCVFVLIIAVPLLVLNYKNYKLMKANSFDRETGIFQVFAGVLYLLTLNIPSTILYIFSGREILKQNPKIHIEYEDPEYEQSRANFNYIISRVLLFMALIFLALIIIIPFYYMILTSLMSQATLESFDTNLFLNLKDMEWINFKEALTKADFGMYIKNTLIVAFFTTAGTVITTIMAAFAFARLEFKGRDLLFSLFLMTMMVPGELYVITNFVTVTNTFNWYNTFYAMVVPFIASIFYIFFLRQTFKQIPDSLYRAAKVDGCSDFKFLTRVMVPVAIPTLITITILSALGTWNAYVWPRLVASDDHYLVSIALRTAFVNEDTGMPDYRLQMAAATIVTVPILVLFLFARKYIMRGVGRSGTKG
ncbi:carbohydrate ABC transporter permease [Haloplasma contractile]|uniref:Sugar ABC transporter permease protein n=1 Tax=Haloplasma contractile SSD-17B TaxID=1033810 RepID=U2FLG7_9MOLU|nr:carbohydrate ABC transporter permease [Haloplasma contractile]ERJ13590.1 Sugar ABC transporter permease protein [Haloplasma contractile SSD-17B]